MEWRAAMDIDVLLLLFLLVCVFFTDISDILDTNVCYCSQGSYWVLYLFFVFADTCYVLSFAVIMLNTSLHNPNVRDKPAVERFISMNRGINEGGDLPEELLRVTAAHCISD